MTIRLRRSCVAVPGSSEKMLRKAGEANAELTRRVTTSDLTMPSVPSGRALDGALTTVFVNRAATRQEYSVPIEGESARAVASTARK